MFDNYIILGFECCNYVLLIQLMVFMVSIRLELEKLGFKLIIGLVVIINYIILIDIIDAIR